MATTRSDSRNTVRSGASRPAHAILCVAVFVLTVLAVNMLGLQQDDRPADGGAATGSVTATVFQRFPTNGPPGLTWPSQADLEREILGQANLRRVVSKEYGGDVSAEMIEKIGENLQVSPSRDSSANTLAVSITSTDSDAHRSVRVVNSLARQYASDQSAKLASMAEQPCRNARDAAEAAGRELLEAQARFHQFLERHFGENGDQAGRTRIWLTRQVSFPSQPLEEGSESPPGMVENPDWSQLSRRLSELTRQRDGMLADRTLLHPEVRAIEDKVVSCRQALRQIPRHVPSPDVAGPSPETPPDSQPLPQALPQTSPPGSVQNPPPLPGEASREHEAAVRDFHIHKVAVEDAAKAYQRLSLAERQAWQRQYLPPSMELQLAPVEESLQAADRSPGTMPMALMVALAMAAGVGMITSGLDNDPTLDTLQQVRAKLSIPVVGTIPAPNPGALTANPRPSNQLSGPTLIGYGAGLVFVSVLILLTTFG